MGDVSKNAPTSCTFRGAKTKNFWEAIPHPPYNLKSQPHTEVLQESLANAKVSARQQCGSKTDFDMKKALKVIVGHFATNFRPTRGRISPCSTDSLNCNVSKEVATEITEN